MLNLHATFTKGTVEFRLFQFDAPADGKKNGLHAGQLKSYIQFALALSQMAKEVKTASPKPQQNENPKYAMRTWLLRLGFIGEEFKATPRNDRLTALRAVCLHILRHIAQTLLGIRRYSCVRFIQADKKSGGAVHTQSLCGIALKPPENFLQKGLQVTPHSETAEPLKRKKNCRPLRWA